MSTTLTIPDLDEAVEQKLQALAVSHGRTVQAEAREILSTAVGGAPLSPPLTREEMRQRLAQIRGLWKGRGTTDELMQMTRGED